TWSAAQYVPGNWPGYWDSNYPYTYSPSVINVGRSVVVAYGSLNYTNVAFGGLRTVSAYWANGTISGSTILWSPVHPITFSTQQTCGPGPSNCMLVGIRHVNLALSPTGSLVLTLNWFYEDSYNSQAGQYMCTRSILYGFYNGPALVLHDSTYYCPVGAVYGMLGGELRSVVTQADAQGLMRVLYWGGTYDSSQRIFRSSFLSRSLDAQGNLGSPETLASYAPDFSALTDNNYGVHVVYTTTSAGVDYVYRSALSESWTPPVSVFAGSAYSPTITLDQSTDKVNVLAVGNSTTSYWTLKMKSKSSIQSWADTTTIYPITEPSFGSFAGYLSANFASASSSSANTICLIWTTGGDSGPYSVMFASIPIQTVWSPYAFPPDPWDGNGLSPYGQYFANLGEYVSPSTGMLTIKQTDLNVPGRGLNLAITRVYVEPYGFLNGAPYNYEKYPWAPMGNGWQLDFPWMNNTQKPNYLHLGDGQGYRIPLVFWAGITATYENHQGENFRLVRYVNGTVYLYDKSGVAYNFDPTHRLTSITDSTGSNTLTFSYSNNMISCVVDTIGRSFTFTYSNGLLQTLRQVSGTCNNPGAIVKTIVYGNNGQSLTSSLDPAGRMTYYSYNGTASSTISAWLVSRVRYPSSWLSNYTYTSALPGTEAYSYRIARQLVSTASGTPVRQFNYIYSQTSGGDQITGSTITAYNATFIGGLWQLQTASYTDYAFSFAGVTWNVSDANHNLVRGVQQRFGIHGEIPREVLIVTDTSGTGWPPGSYTNYYRYDLWGNPIYSRKVINPSTNSYHESFSTYYNGGLSPGFNAFQETFSQNQGTDPDNTWANQNGYWMVQNGSYNGTDTSSQPESIFAWSDVGKADISIQARVYVTYRINSPDQRIGLLAHYPGTGTNMWALVFHTTTVGAKLSLLEEAVGWRAENSCTIWFNSWYTLNFTMRGNQAWGWTNGLGGSCSVSATFTGALASATGFGLYSGGSSALFDNVTVATVSPSITGSGFSNSFNLAGAPGANIHNGLAGTAELQNGTGTLPIETYYSYYPWGGLSQEKHRYDSSGIVEWLTMSSTYDSYGNLLTLVDARGNTTSYGYSSKYAYAYLTSLNRTVAGTLISTRYGYDYASGMKLWVYDPNGFNTTYQYDIVGRVTRITYPTLNFTTYRYNDQANYANITSENGWRTRQIYDGLGRLSITQRFLAGVPYSNETTTYNWMDKTTSRVDSMGNVYSYQYDVLGRQVKTVGPDGNFTRVLYNDVASWLELIDESGFIKFLAYDRLGRLIEADEQTSPSALRATSYTYDESGNLGAIVTYDNPLRNPETRVQYVYDNLNRMVSARYQDGTSESYTYDSNSNLVGKVDRKNVQTGYSYDSLSRIATITYYGSTVTSDSYTYDRNSNLLQLQSQNATIRYTYDPRSRVLNENYTINTGGSVRTYAVRYTYNGGLLATITYPDNLVVKYNYDSLGRILAVSKSGGTTYATFSYYRNDKVRGIGFGSGLVANYTYDRLARPLTITLKNGAVTLYSLTYGYNRTGTVASVIGQVNQISDNEQYRYDPLARLTNATITSGGTTNRLWYEYDGPGNRLRQNLNGVLTSYTYTPSNNQLVGSSTPGTAAAYSYDANGNQAIRNVTTTGTAHWTYSWDVANRLVKVRNDAGVQGAYAYDGEGRRVESIEASTTFYAYLGTETLYETVTGGAGTDYIHAGGFRIGKVSGTTINYYHTDSLGSTRLVTNTSKGVVFSDNYQPFGQDNGTHTGSETYKFTGKPVSAATGLYYEYSRWYDPGIGRFISQDPSAGHVSDPQSLNPYICVMVTRTAREVVFSPFSLSLRSNSTASKIPRSVRFAVTTRSSAVRWDTYKTIRSEAQSLLRED
ncbi:RHS repeat protein, partial [Candidatus Bathyarchaeota archaeon]